MAKMPKWAQDLVIQVALDEGRERLPDVTWRRSRWEYLSGGRTWSPGILSDHPDGRVLVTAGKDRRDQKLVLLHELAHWLMPHEHHHDAAYWDKAWDLYYRYRVPVRYALQRESKYRKGAMGAYRRRRNGS